ncbi:11631_t:CDS:2 [Funneliformis caledonium]|uniref:11631_t:CDS:1 n=1 Tax=Funneliformis caledonium TaxID=1117310 RepID=A0A9N9I5W0_9GLOM|nr:11631_t:CDS:2 [Funneliformis caledonium]
MNNNISNMESPKKYYYTRLSKISTTPQISPPKFVKQPIPVQQPSPIPVCLVTAQPIIALIHLITAAIPTVLQITTLTCQPRELIERYPNIRILRSISNEYEVELRRNMKNLEERIWLLEEENSVLRNNPYELPRMSSVDRPIFPDESNAIGLKDRLKKRKAEILGKVDRRLHANTHLIEANNNNKYYETDETNEMNEFINYDYFDAKDNMNDKDYLTNLFFAEEIEDYDERSESSIIVSARMNEMQLDKMNKFFTTIPEERATTDQKGKESLLK